MSESKSVQKPRSKLTPEIFKRGREKLKRVSAFRRNPLRIFDPLPFLRSKLTPDIFKRGREKLKAVKVILLNPQTHDIKHIDSANLLKLSSEDFKESLDKDTFVTVFVETRVIFTVSFDFGCRVVKKVITDKVENLPKRILNSVNNYFTPIPAERWGDNIHTLSDIIDSIPPELDDDLKINRQLILNNEALSDLYEMQKSLNYNHFAVISLNIFSNIVRDDVFKIDIMNRKLFSSRGYKINWFSQLVDKGYSKNGSCLPDYIKSLYNQSRDEEVYKRGNPLKSDKDLKKYIKKTRDRILSLKGKTASTLKKFVFKYNIPFTCYDYNGNILFNNAESSLIYERGKVLLHDNHIYPLKYSAHVNPKDYKLVDDIENKFSKLIKRKILPWKLKVSSIGKDSIKITSFVHKGKKYVDDHEYSICDEILAHFYSDGLIGKTVKNYHIPTSIDLKTKNLGMFLANKMCKNAFSFFPACNKFRKGGFHFKTTPDLDREIITIDKNKCYAYCLNSLNYLIQMDYREEVIHEGSSGAPIEPSTPLVDEYLYTVKISTPTLLLPNNNLYSGGHLKFCLSEGEKFCITSYITAKKTYNSFKPIITTLMNKFSKEHKKDVKSIINLMIGQFESCGESVKNEIVDIFPKGVPYVPMEASYKCSYENVNIYFKTKISHSWGKFKPVAIQVKDYSRRLLHEKMSSLGLTMKDVLKINTDSISFYKDSAKLPRGFFTSMNGSGFNGWKIENWEPPSITDFDCISRNGKLLLDVGVEESLHANTPLQDKMSSVSGFRALTGEEVCLSYDGVDIKELIKEKIKLEHKDSILYNAPAGSGKTTKIIQMVKKLQFSDYIVLTPTYASLKEYKEYKETKINCDIIHNYIYGRELKENIIFIDEIGLCGDQIQTWLCSQRLTKTIYSFGDFTQLPPVNCSPMNSKQYIEYLYDRVETIDKNWRNDIPKHVYDILRYGDISIAHKIVLGFMSKKPRTKAECLSTSIIAYTNKTCEKWNKRVNRKITGKSMFVFSKGALVYYTKNHKSLYNKRGFTISRISRPKYIAKNTSGKKFKVLYQDMSTIPIVVVKEGNKTVSYKRFRNALYDSDGVKKYSIKKVSNAKIVLKDDKENFIIDNEKNIKFAYCQTLHSWQGRQCSSYYFADDIKLLDSRGCYTLVSRLKGKHYANLSDEFKELCKNIGKTIKK